MQFPFEKKYFYCETFLHENIQLVAFLKLWYYVRTMLYLMIFICYILETAVLHPAPTTPSVASTCKYLFIIVVLVN